MSDWIEPTDAAWLLMRRRVAMHTRWEAQYHRRHPHLAASRGGMSVWAGLRIARLRWTWAGRPAAGSNRWQYAFQDYWGLMPRYDMSLAERLQRAGITPAALAAKLIEIDKIGLLPRPKEK